MTAVILAMSLACLVPKKDYDALQVELDQTRVAMEAAVAERDANIGSLEEGVVAGEAEVARLEGEVAELESSLASEKAALTALEAEKAALLKDKTRLRQSVAEMEQALAEARARKAAADKRLAEFKGLLERFKGLIDAGRLKVRIVDGQMVLELATDILFESGKAALSDEGRAALAEVATALAGIAERRFQVSGHTDDDPIKTAQYPNNWYLASARAIVVVEELVAGGLAPSRLSAASYAEHQPRVANDSPETKAQNRRIEIVVVPDLSQLPGFDELQALEGGD